MSLDTKSAIIKFLKENGVVVGLFVLGIFFVGWGVVLIYFGDNEEIEFLSDSGVEIAVDISGAVINPGVYYLNSGDRIHNALISAGGLSGEADREYISQNVNLARVLEDGEKIYIPFYGEDIVDEKITADLVGNNEFISLNNATIGQLKELPGVGDVIAERIVNGRPYGSLDEIKTAGVVGEKLFEKIKNLISL